ncbi:MAG: type I polyketide synthase, partial [Acidimicrobiales bacterium]|nr:type I polyketide synthase [Acidimicrobiales bacterium]
IAIVGICSRLPGGVTDPESLCQLLPNAVDTKTTIPSDRFDVEALYDERPATPGRIMSRWGGFVDDIEGFDTRFFEMAPREAERLDPQQRLLLETSWEALEDSGTTRHQLAGTSAGVYVGLWTNEYEGRFIANREHIDFHMTTGSGRYAASGRLSYFFDLLGPSVTVDTACSSSLVAIHLACSGLLAGECDLALAGGANVIVDPYITIAYSQSRMMAADGHCKFGDAGANGYVRSDGAVMVALKRLSTATAAGDHIYALIRGSAVTNDGRSSGFMATPGQAGQEHMLRRAYASAGVDPRSVQYVEAHGTGTAAGDPVELGAIGSVVGVSRDQGDPCLVGSIKSNVGHTEGAAGAAGLVKLALALQHGEIPASLHVDEPNPTVAWDQLGLRVNREHRAWPATDGPRRGGVSAFGIAGTNAHIVLEQAPPPTKGPAATERGSHLLAISANGSAALRALAHRYADLLAAGTGSLADLVAATNRRNHLRDRLTVVGSSADELAGELRRKVGTLDPRAPHRRSAAEPRVVFVFPGQGSQWPGMARELLTDEPAFATAMARCDAAIRAEAGWSPIELLTADEVSPRMDDIDVVQPLLFAVQVSLAALWASWGITPDAVVGHSMGEVAAAQVAGALTLTDAAAVICRRSSLLRRISGQGAMALVDLPLAEATAAIAGLEAVLSIAVSNSPRSTVISGDPAALQTVLDRLQAADVFCRPVKVDVASHSPQVEPLLAELRAQLADLRPVASAVPFRSTVAGRVLDGESLDADYWAANLRRPVLFGDAIAELASERPTAFVELSPHPILLPSIEQVIRDVEPVASVVASMRRDEPEVATMLAGLGALHECGVEADLSVVTGRPATHVALPTYPWQRERHWYEPSALAPGVPSHGQGRRAPVRHAELLHEICWRPSPGASPADPVSQPRRWLVYASPAAGEQLVGDLSAAGDECIVVRPGSAFACVSDGEFTIDPGSAEHHRRVVDDVVGRAGPTLAGVVYLWGAGVRTDVSDAAMFGCIAPVAMLQAFGASAASPRVWFVTRGAFAAAPTQAMLWGLGRVAATELPALRCSLVDLDPGWGGEGDLFAELQLDSVDQQVSFLAGERRVSRLARAAGGRSESTGPAVRADSTYLVTGGTGGLGLAIAERLVERGARHIALMARRGGSLEVDRAVSSLRDRGASVQLVLADVSDAAQLAHALAVVRSTMPPLRGVIHAAGVLADSTIDAIDEARVRSVLAPKLHGGWNLHEATLDDPLDHFVLFSSVAAVLGLAGQSNYAAANAFLDALAAHRRSLGRPALSIQWGPWASIGLAASAANRGARLADRGLGSVDPSEALDVFDELLDRGRADVAVMRFDADLWVAGEPSSGQLLGELAHAGALPTADPSARADEATMAEQIIAASLADRVDVAEACVRGLVGRVLKLPEDRIDSTTPFGTLGFDSLMSLELHNWIEREFGLQLSATVAWNYPSVKELAAHLLALLTRDHQPIEPSVAMPGAADSSSDVASLAVDVSGLSDDEALDALMGGGAR